MEASRILSRRDSIFFFPLIRRTRGSAVLFLALQADASGGGVYPVGHNATKEGETVILDPPKATAILYVQPLPCHSWFPRLVSIQGYLDPRTESHGLIVCHPCCPQLCDHRTIGAVHLVRVTFKSHYADWSVYRLFELKQHAFHIATWSACCFDRFEGIGLWFW